MEKLFETLVHPIQDSNIQEPTIEVSVIKEPPTIQESNTLKGALATKIAFEDRRIDEVEKKKNQRDLLMMLNKPTLIEQIGFVIPNEFKDVGIKVFLFTRVVKDIMAQASMVKILIIHHSKIQGQVFSNLSVQASISMSSNRKDKIHLEGEWNFMTWVLDKLFQFNSVLE